jgi:hypothetical protein
MNLRMLPKPEPLFHLPPHSVSIARDLAAALDPELFMLSTGLKPEPWQRELLRSTAIRLALLCPRQSGKSTATARVALHHAIYHCDAVVLVLSPSQRQSDLLFEKIIEGFEAMPEKPAGARAIAGRLELPNGSRIISLPGNEKTIRGLSADLIVVDEAAQVSDALFNTVLPMVIARSGRIIALSTPFGKRGFFYKACTASGSRWRLIKITAEESALIGPEKLEEARQTYDPHWYRQEFLCEFLGDSTQYFDSELIAAAFDPQIEPFYEVTGHAY